MKLNREVKEIIRKAIKEDIGSGDITTNHFVERNRKYKALVIAKTSCVLCGLKIAERIFKFLNKENKVKLLKKDGDKVRKGEVIMEIFGDKTILSAERTALNFLQHLSGIATKTYQFVKIATKYNVRIYDTRKTIPGLRVLQKYAVKRGGGFNHRNGLYEHFMIKDNHLMALDNDFNKVCEKMKKIQKRYRNKKIEIEVQNIRDLKKIIKLKPDIIMLDNMKPPVIRKAVLLIRKSCKNTEIEISGGINEKNIKKFLSLGIDRISIGALTHSAKAIDISLDIMKEGSDM